MKKLLIVALALVPVLFACKKNSSVVPEAKMEIPETATNAAKVELSTPITISATSTTATGTKKVKAALKSIEFLRSGRYIATGVVAKADEEAITLVGKWSYKNGKYEMQGDITASVEVSGSSSDADVKVTTQEEGTQTSDAKVEEGKQYSEDSTENKIFRNWKIAKIVLKDFEKLGSTSVTATSLTAMVKEIKNKGITISSEAEQKLLDHEVVEITFDEGILIIKFVNGSTFTGEMPKVSASAGSATFSVDLSSFIKDNADKVNGTITFDGQNAVLTLDVPNVQSMGAGKAIITLAQA